jgi:hypothetical protein
VSDRARITCGQLLERGDRAMRDADPVALGRVGQLLAGRMGDPLTHRLHVFVRSCAVAGADLAPAWGHLRREITDRMEIAGT